jgi:uncharacterized protein YfeS
MVGYVSKIAIVILVASVFLFTFNKTIKKPSQNTIAMDGYQLSPETANPKAKALLTEEFYWNPVEESSPFGNDAGSDAFYGFRKWRVNHKGESPLSYLGESIKRMGYPSFNWNELDTSIISKYIFTQETDTTDISKYLPAMLEHLKKHAQESGESFDEAKVREALLQPQPQANMGVGYLLDQDNAITAVAFGQFVLEGRIDKDLKTLTRIAITRQLLPLLLDNYGASYKNVRKIQLDKMLQVLDKMDE